MTNAALAAHSLAEAYLCLAATPCAECGRGPVIGCEQPTVQDQDVRIDTKCDSCGFESSKSFRMVTAPTDDTNPSELNGADEPSRLIDVGQWMTLYQIIMDTAESQSNKVFKRELKIHAAQCVTEALKFYDDPDSDLPPPAARFFEPTRRRFHDAPQQFARDRLMRLRAALPVPLCSEEPQRTPASNWRRVILAAKKQLSEDTRR